MNTLVVRSIPLSRETRDSLKSIPDLTLMKRSRRINEAVKAAHSYGYDVLWNYGNTQDIGITENDTVLIVNEPGVVKQLVTPGAMRRSLGEFLPPLPYPGDKGWVKGPGRGGQNKDYHENVGDFYLSEHSDYDVQTHIVGQEYRVVTVGHKVVQGFIRYGANGNRAYVWCGLAGLPDGLKDFVRKAAKRLHGMNVLSWDTIREDDTGRFYIFEGNTSPGLNEATAGRVYKTLKEYYDNVQ